MLTGLLPLPAVGWVFLHQQLRKCSSGLANYSWAPLFPCDSRFLSSWQPKLTLTHTFACHFCRTNDHESRDLATVLIVSVFHSPQRLRLHDGVVGCVSWSLRLQPGCHLTSVFAIDQERACFSTPVGYEAMHFSAVTEPKITLIHSRLEGHILPPGACDS